MIVTRLALPDIRESYTTVCTVLCHYCILHSFSQYVNPKRKTAMEHLVLGFEVLRFRRKMQRTQTLLRVTMKHGASVA